MFDKLIIYSTGLFVTEKPKEVDITGNMLVVILVVHLLFHVLTLLRYSTNSSYYITLSVYNAEYIFCLSLSEEEVTTKERALMFGGVGLAIAVFFVATVVAGGIIHYRGWQKGWAAAKRSSLIYHKSAK